MEKDIPQLDSESLQKIYADRKSYIVFPTMYDLYDISRKSAIVVYPDCFDDYDFNEYLMKAVTEYSKSLTKKQTHDGIVTEQ